METVNNLHTNPYRNREVSDQITRAIRALNRAASVADAHGDPRANPLHETGGKLGLLLIKPTNGTQDDAA